MAQPGYEAIIIGAGIAGMYQLYRLRELGMRVRVFEAGSDVGGTWYWNRYPGARFDSESWSYGYSFSQELLQEWEWPEHFAAQPDTLRYLNHVADKFDLRRDMQFHSRVTAATWDEAATRWTITLESGEQASAPLLITALGPLSAYTLPNIPGRDDFAGPAFHTARWPREGVDLRGKRVGIIGTGATAIQTIQTIAKEVGHLTVFQRTPNWAAPLHNRPITPEEQAQIKASYAEIFERCRQTDTCFIHQADPRRALDVSPEEREAFWEKLYAEPGFGIWVGNFRDVLVDPAANALMTEWAKKKIRERVKDPVTAEKLIPKNHGFGTRRLPLESGYYEVYNQPNVELVDINETPIERITPRGIRTSEREHEFDILIYATGFDGVTGPYDRIAITGPGGRSLREDWRGTPRTFLGVLAEGFPNMLMVLGPHTARGNIPRNIEEIVDWLTGLVRYMREHGHRRVEAREAAVEDWAQHVEKAAAGLLFTQVASWQTGVNRNVEGREEVRRTLGYYGGAVKYRRISARVAAEGYRELRFA
ncbi:NAD(P)/FAD-dependent oxidoreductase [Siccirubricoccus sp. KC 17139]|uniref:NAD(P)/FAD-dependent oxidoreductase n=1 Tax=Siccirubricoccus soli TaxID=2899147 RepID=A0ABT1D3S0_9PROT|nr:NAD(P)/FAD-dependent oxidoreductase [Siccirubricoccus soli]MCO6416267.1 NAD(P)/FAD-dependent oxidoreductase [Siccirubricoccus soli]MCP2682401.1 NAD(P)/FAD-dependent oxidoreductase [Siccirubricoccus soli]